MSSKNLNDSELYFPVKLPISTLSLFLSRYVTAANMLLRQALTWQANARALLTNVSISLKSVFKYKKYKSRSDAHR